LAISWFGLILCCAWSGQNIKELIRLEARFSASHWIIQVKSAKEQFSWIRLTRSYICEECTLLIELNNGRPGPVNSQIKDIQGGIPRHQELFSTKPLIRWGHQHKRTFITDYDTIDYSMVTSDGPLDRLIESLAPSSVIWSQSPWELHRPTTVQTGLDSLQVTSRHGV
jgi:hypothetical protein